MSRRARIVSLAALATAGTLAFSGCVSAAIDAADRDAPTTSTSAPGKSEDPTPTESAEPDDVDVTEPETIDAWSLRVGHCFDDPAVEDTFTEIEVLPCAEPHDNEIYYRFDLPDGDFPGDDVVAEAATDACATEFEVFIGVPYQDSELEYWSIYPETLTWEELGDREVLCIAFDPKGPVSGTLKDAGV